MNERIKELAEQAELVWSRRDGYWIAYDDSKDLERFAELVRADERELCAKVCEKVADDYKYDRNKDGYDWPDGHDCAEAIRARGNT